MSISFIYGTEETGFRIANYAVYPSGNEFSAAATASGISGEEPLPAELAVYYNDWSAAIDDQAAFFYAVSGTTIVETPVSGIYNNESIFEPGIYGATVYFDHDDSTYERVDIFGPGEVSGVYAFAQDLHPTLFIDYVPTAAEVNRRGQDIINSELGAYANYASITGSGVPSGVAFVTSVAADYTTVYASPSDAKIDFQGGASGIARSNGYSWGPPALSDP